MLKLILKFSFLLLVLLSCTHNQEKIKILTEKVYSNSYKKYPLPPKPFVSDGCSCWPDFDWAECCVEHDLIYWMGGTRLERKIADIKLKKCVTDKGHAFIGSLMYYGVRIGGVWWLPTSFRWGFGWKYPKSGPPNIE